jgi:hypothetical protein
MLEKVRRLARLGAAMLKRSFGQFTPVLPGIVKPLILFNFENPFNFRTTLTAHLETKRSSREAERWFRPRTISRLPLPRGSKKGVPQVAQRRSVLADQI